MLTVLTLLKVSNRTNSLIHDHSTCTVYRTHLRVNPLRSGAEDKEKPCWVTSDPHSLTSAHVAAGDSRPPMHLSVGFGSHIIAPAFPAVTGYCNQWHCHCTFIAYPKLPLPGSKFSFDTQCLKACLWFINSQENTGWMGDWVCEWLRGRMGG